jgi:hypothetical protein
VLLEEEVTKQLLNCWQQVLILFMTSLEAIVVGKKITKKTEA